MAIGVAELSYVSRQVDSQTLQTFAAFGVATVLYIAIIAVMEGWGQWRQQRNLAQGYKMDFSIIEQNWQYLLFGTFRMGHLKALH